MFRNSKNTLPPLPQTVSGSRGSSPHLAGADAWVAQFGAMAEANKNASATIRWLVIVIVVLIVVMGLLYKSTTVRMYVREVDANGVALRTTQLEQLTEVSDVMKRDAVQRFFRALRSSSMDLRYQDMLSRTALALTAGSSPAHQMVEAFGETELPERRKREIDAQVTAHPLSENKWRVDVVEIDRNGDRHVFTAYATVDVAVQAQRNVDLNPWGVFVRSFSMDSLGGDP